MWEKCKITLPDKQGGESKMRKKLVMCLMAGCLAVGMAGCSGNGGTGSEETNANGDVKEDGEVSNEEGEQVTLEFMNGSAEEQYVAWLDEMIAGFEEENPGIDVEVNRISIDNYSQTVMTRFAAGDVPDLFSFAENDIADMVPSGYVMDLTDSVNVSNYSEGILDSLSKDGKVYALPVANDFMCVTYNKEVFEEAGIKEVPDTWEKFMDVCETLKSKDVTPLAAGMSEQWVVNGTAQTVYCAAVLGNGGPDLSAMIDRSENFAGVEQWRDFFTKLQDMYPYMNEDLFGTDQNTAYTMLANGDAAMIANISTAVTNVMAMNPDGEYGIFALPVSEKSEDNIMPMCPPAAGIAISAETKHPEEARSFLEYLTSPESVTRYAELGAGIPIVQGVDTSALEGAFKDGADMINNGDVKLISSKSFPSANEDAFINAVSDFFLEECTDIDGTLESLDTSFDNLQ